MKELLEVIAKDLWNIPNRLWLQKQITNVL